MTLINSVADVMKPVELRLTLTLDEAAARSFADLLTPALRQALSPAPSEADTKREARLLASRKALFGGEELPTDRGLLIDGKEAAKLLAVSERTLHRMSQRGEMPPFIKIGSAVRWSFPALKEWVEAGCPKSNNG